MLITQVVLENWKSYASATVNFTQGANAIIGHNGAGKSSVLEAIGYAVFDARPVGYTNATMVREGSKSARLVVSLVSPLDGRTYDIERRLSSHTTTRYRVTDPELDSVTVANGAQEVRQWVIDNLDLGEGTTPSELFTQTLGVPQGTITQAFNRAPAERKRIFDPLLRVNEYRDAADRLNPAQRQLADRTHDLDERLAYIKGQLVRQETLLADITDLENNVAQDDVLLDRLTGELARAQAQVDAYNAQQITLQSARTEVLQARNTHAMQAQSLDAAQADLAKSAQARDLVAAAEPGHVAYLAAQQQLDKLDQARQQRDDLLREQSAAQRRQAALDTQVQQLAQRLDEIARASAEMDSLAPRVEEQTEFERRLSKAEQAQVRLLDAQREQKRLDRQHQQRDEEHGRLIARLAEAADTRDAIVNINNALTTARERHNDLYARGMQLKAKEAEITEQTRVLQETTSARCPVCEAELTDEHRAELMARNQGALAEAKRDRDATREAFQQTQSDVKRLEGELAQAQARAGGLPQQPDIDRAEQALAQAQREHDQGLLTIASLEKSAADIDTLRKALSELGDPRAQRNGFQAQVRDLDKVTQSLAQARQQQGAVVSEIGRLAQALNPLADLDDQVAAARAERDTHADAHDAFLTHRASAQRFEALSEQTTRLQDELADAEATLAAHQDALARAEADYDAQAHAQAVDQLQDAGQQRAAAESRLTANKNRLAALHDELGAMEALAHESTALESERAAVQRQRQVLQFVQNTLRAAGPHITERKVQTISTTASELFGDIMEDHRGRLRWDKEYELSLDVAGHERGFRQLSGGEQMTAALALRLALLKETSDLRLAFLDEPTAHMDEARREVLSERILQVQGFDQLFVISHDDTFERLAANFVHIVKDENGSHLEADGDGPLSPEV